MAAVPFGYLMVHFVEDPDGYAEKIYLSLSRGEDPTRWYRLNGGEPVLSSGLGTTGVRDPHLVRGPGRFYLVATDLRVFRGDDAGWHAWSHHGSRSIMVWETPDLMNWSPGRLVEVEPENGAGGIGYRPFVTDDLAAGNWKPYDGDFDLPPHTKHGVVLPLLGDEWERLAGGGQRPE